jgi:hypothetical protein
MILSATYKVMFAFDNIVQTMHNEYPAFFIGAHINDSLTQECTHVLVDQLRPVKEDIVDAILSKKPIVLDSWVKVNYHEIS